MSIEQHERILVVDDNPASLYSTARIIKQAGFRVVESATGHEALEKVKDSCDLVVLDVDLPDIDGHEVCRRIRQTPNISRIPVIHLSATFVSDYHKMKGLEAGADGYLTHPVEPLVLIATIKAFLRTRQMENALSISEAKFRAIFDQSLMGICLISDDMIFLDVNPAMCNMMGRNREEIIGKHCAAFARAGHESRLVEIADQFRQHQTWHGQMPLVHRLGKLVELEWTISVHSTSSVLLALIADVTEKRRIEHEREALLQSERSARMSAERANRLKDEFLATLSHELRTPLSAVIGWSQVLLMRPPSAHDLAEGLEAISRNAKAQSEMINDLLDVSRIMSGKLRLNIQEIDPVAIIHDALLSVTPAAKAKGILLEHNLNQTFAPIHADPSRLQQIVWNLVNNAVKFTTEFGRVKVVVDQLPSWLAIRVSDTGQGIKPEFLPFLFERFRQEDATTTRVFGGLGLGLAIVKQLVELHGGSVEATSAGEGQGAEFIVRLPFLVAAHFNDIESEPAQLSASRSKSSAAKTAAQVDLTNTRILIVDDDVDSRKLMSRVLKECNAEVFEAESVKEACELLTPFKPHLLVSDIGMPHLDGYELIRRVRALGIQGDQLPAIAVTAFTRPEDRQRILEHGFQSHVGKPLSLTDFLTEISVLLGKL